MGWIKDQKTIKWEAAENERLQSYQQQICEFPGNADLCRGVSLQPGLLNSSSPPTLALFLITGGRLVPRYKKKNKNGPKNSILLS